jgi:hypothetical protein
MPDPYEFFTSYDDLVTDVSNALPGDFPLHLIRWFGNIEEYAPAAVIVKGLEGPIDPVSWLERAQREATSGIGTTSLPWSTDSSELLGQQLGLCRLLSRRDLDPQNLVVNYMYSSSARHNAENSVRTLVQQVFRPLARDLRRRLWREIQDAQLDETLAIPAADRVVRIDHNSAAYQDALAKLDSVSEALRGANLPDPELKAQLTTELAVGRSLFESPRVRLAAVRIVLIGVLATLSVFVPGFAVNIAAGAAMLAVQACLSAAREAQGARSQ